MVVLEDSGNAPHNLVVLVVTDHLVVVPVVVLEPASGPGGAGSSVPSPQGGLGGNDGGGSSNSSGAYGSGGGGGAGNPGGTGTFSTRNRWCWSSDAITFQLLSEKVDILVVVEQVV